MGLGENSVNSQPQILAILKRTRFTLLRASQKLIESFSEPALVLRRSFSTTLFGLIMAEFSFDRQKR